ncbi:DNA-binding protein [Thiomonas sp. X19]|uniref:DNA-binding protein n=1 Tax=Thiomonas sp. X19 TaxID=1050370 RepID=UPI000DD88413|nr:DNA-binding protein [Thiomonas sp. X19]
MSTTQPKVRTLAPRDTEPVPTDTPPPASRGASADITASTRNGVTAVTRNGVTNEAKVGDTPVTALHGYDDQRPLAPSRGLTARASSFHLRDAIYEKSLLLADRFRVIRTIDVAALCFPERPFKASLTAAQRAVRGMVKRGLLRRYRTDRFQTVYGLTQPGVDWLGEHGHDAASSVRRVSDMTNPEHRLWAQFLVVCSWARGLRAVTEAELLQDLNANAKTGTRNGSSKTVQGYLTVSVHRRGASVRKHLRPDAVAYEAEGKGVVWFEVDRSKRGSERQADLAALVGAIGGKLADSNVLRRVVVMCKTQRIERDAVRVVEQLAAASNEQVLIEGRRHIRRQSDGVFEVIAANPVKRKDGRTALVDEEVGHVIVQMLPTWLPKVRIDASNRWSMDGWFGDNYLPYRRPPSTGRWEVPVSPLVPEEAVVMSD